MALAVHTYNNRVNNTRLLKQTAPLSAAPLLHFPENIWKKTKKTITTLAATDAAITKPHWHSQFVSCQFLSLIYSKKQKSFQTPQPTPQPPPRERNRVASSCVRQLGGCWAVTRDRERPSCMSPDAAEERGAKGHDLGIGFLVGVCIPKKKGTRQLSTLSLRLASARRSTPPATPHPID